MSTQKTTTRKTTNPPTTATRKPRGKKPAAQTAEKDITTTVAAEPAKTTKPVPEKAPGKLSALDAAAKVLGETKEPMTSKELIDAMAAQGYWTSPGGKTPQATLYAAILREMQIKGAEARFTKTERGHFALTTQ